MKTLKFTVVAAMIACMMIGTANADDVRLNPKFKKVVNVTLEQAVKNPELVQAMYKQLCMDYILHNPAYIFTAELIYKGNLYRITGAREEWIRFYRKIGTRLIDKVKVMISE